MPSSPSVDVGLRLQLSFRTRSRQGGQSSQGRRRAPQRAFPAPWACNARATHANAALGLRERSRTWTIPSANATRIRHGKRSRRTVGRDSTRRLGLATGGSSDSDRHRAHAVEAREERRPPCAQGMTAGECERSIERSRRIVERAVAGQPLTLAHIGPHAEMKRREPDPRGCPVRVRGGGNSVALTDPSSGR